MKSILSLVKTTALGGVVFLLPLVLVVVVVGKAFNVVKTVATPMANLISAEKIAGYAQDDRLPL